MDIERIQKINSMAMDLLRQGLAQNKDEAIAQAEKMFRSRDGDTRILHSSGLKQNSLQVDASAASSSAASSPAQTSGSSVVLDQAKIQEILKKNSQFLVSKIKEFQATVDQLQTELASVKSQLIAAKRAAAAAPRPAQNQQGGSSSAQQQPSGSGSSSSKPHPRSGGYNANDVSIEKFFYAGNR